MSAIQREIIENRLLGVPCLSLTRDRCDIAADWPFLSVEILISSRVSKFRYLGNIVRLRIMFPDGFECDFEHESLKRSGRLIESTRTRELQQLRIVRQLLHDLQPAMRRA